MGGSASTGCTVDGTTGDFSCTGTFNGVDVTQANGFGAATTVNLGIAGASGTMNLMGGSASTGCTVDGTTGDFSCSGDLAVNGGDITTTSATGNLFQTNATTVNIGGASNTINLGGGSASTGCTLDATTGNLVCTGTFNGVDVTQAFIQNGNSFGANAVLGTNDNFSLSFETNGTTQATLSTAGDLTLNNDLYVIGTTGLGTTASATSWLDIGANTTTVAQLNLTPSAAIDVSAPNAGDLWFNGTNLYFDDGTTTFDLLAGSPCITCFHDGGDSFGGNAVLGTNDNFTLAFETNGTTQATISTAGDLTLNNDLAVNGGDLTTTAGTFNLVNIGATTVNGFGAATTVNLGIAGASGTMNLMGGDASTGCTLDGTTGDFSCTGTFNGVDLGDVILQGGNTFGTTVTIGTTDNFDLDFITNGVVAMTIDNSQNVTINNDITVDGDSIFNSNVTLGDAAGDTITFNGTVDSDIDPFADNTYDLGSLSLRWRDLYLGPGSLRITSTTGTSGTGANYTLLEGGFNGGAARFVTTNNGTNTAGNFGAFNFISGMNTGQTTNAAFDFRTTANLGAADELFQISDNNGTDIFLTVLGNGNVGVGTASPSARLSVGATSQFQVNANGEMLQTLASTTTIGHTVVVNSLTSGRGLDITSTATAFTGDLQRISLTGNNAANTGDLLELNINGASNAATGLRIVNTGTGVSLAVDSGRITHTFAGTTTTANTVTLNSLTTGRGLDMTSTATAFTGAMQRISLTGNNAANTGDLLTLSISGAASAARGLFIDNRGTGLSLRIDDQAADSSPFAIDADGFVGIGALPNSAYKVLIQNTITDTAAINQFGLIVNTLVNNSAGGIAVGNKAGQFQVIAGTGANPMGSIAAITSHVGTTGAGTASILESNTSGITVSSGATVTTLANYGATTNISGGSTITDWTGVSVYPLNISGGATVANAVGIRINTVAGATTNTGLLIEGATQFSLLVNSGLSRFNGTVEINGTTTIAADLSVTGDIFAVGAATGTGNRYVCMTNGTSVLLRSTTACNPSSLRFKENISDLDYGLNEILALRPVFYHYKPEFDSDTSKQIGFIAEELALILPELGAYEEDGVTLQGLDYPKLTAVNTKAIQELNSIVVGNFLSLSAEDMNMYTLLNGLEDRVVVLEDDVDTLGLTVDAQNTSLTDLGNAVNSHATDLLNLATADVNQMNLYNALEGTVAAIDSRLITVEGLIAGFTYQGQIDALSVRVTALENGGVIRGTTTVTYVDNVTVTAVPFGQNITNAIVTASPVGFDGKFKIQNITATGFEIVVTEMNPAPLVNDEIIFNWIVAK